MSLSRRALACAAAVILLAVLGTWSGEPLDGSWRWPAALLAIFIVWERLRLPQDFAIRRNLAKAVLSRTGHVAPSATSDTENDGNRYMPVGTALQTPSCINLPLGELSGYTLTATNRGRRLLLLDTQTDFPPAIESENPLQRWCLKPGETQIRTLPILPVELGTAPLGALYLRILGPFGLCWWTQRSDDGISVGVEPARPEPTVHAAGFARAGARRSRHKAGHGFELLELRDYRHGDALRSIDWKATARRGKPVVRSFEREQRLEIVVLIDCGRASRIHCDRLDRLHHYVNAAARLTEIAAAQDDRIACLAYAHRLIATAPMAGGVSAVKCIRNLLGGLSAGGEESNPLNAALEVKRLIQRRGLVVFLTDIEQPEAASQLVQAVHLLAAKHHVLVASLEDPSVAGIPRQAAIQWADPYRHFSALEYLRGRELTRNKLQRAGVAVVSAAAEHLGRQVLEYYRRQRAGIT
jgi:uncharacterized protein (DUF58 family)